MELPSDVVAYSLMNEGKEGGGEGEEMGEGEGSEFKPSSALEYVPVETRTEQEIPQVVLDKYLSLLLLLSPLSSSFVFFSSIFSPGLASLPPLPYPTHSSFIFVFFLQVITI